MPATAPIQASIAVFDDGVVRVERVSLPARGPGEVDVAIDAAAICGSDLHTVLGHRPAPPRTALGHEGVGRVVDADPSAVDLRGAPVRAGDRVVFALFRACGTCDRCVGGLEMKCRSLLKYGHESVQTAPHATGTLATHVRLLPGVPVIRVPDDIDDAQIVSAGCAVATAAAIVAAAGPPPPGARVLVLGAGAVGAYSVAMLADRGCDVRVADPDPARCATAGELGARVGGAGEADYPAVIEASGHPDAVQQALGAAAVGGRVVLAGSVSPGRTQITVDPAAVVTRRLAIVGIHNYRTADFTRAVDWLLERGSDPRLARLVSAPMPLAAIDDAFRLMRAGRHHRVLIAPRRGGAPTGAPGADGPPDGASDTGPPPRRDQRRRYPPPTAHEV